MGPIQVECLVFAQCPGPGAETPKPQGASILDTMRYVPVHERHPTQKQAVLETMHFGFCGQTTTYTGAETNLGKAQLA